MSQIEKKTSIRRESYRTKEEAEEAFQRYAKRGYDVARDLTNWSLGKFTISVETSKERNPDFTVCPDCGCDEALILAVGILENEGKLEIYCPVCEKRKVVKKK